MDNKNTYRLSKYNVYAYHESNQLVFNSLRNTYTILNKDYDYSNNTDYPFLIKQGILVDEGIDEEKEAFIKFIDTCDEKTLGLTIMPTMACNFRCPYCYEDHESVSMSDETINSIIEFVKKKIQSVERVSVSWFGGEPTLCLETIERLSTEIIKICKFYRKPYIANMTTNGYLLNADLMKRFIKYRILTYQITIDGNKEEHDSIRYLVNHSGTYDVIINNLLDIRDHVSFQNIGIILRVNVTKETFKEFDTTVDELEEMFGNDERFSFIFRRVGDWGGDSVKSLSNQLVEDEDELINKLINYRKRLRMGSQFTEFGSGYGLCYAGKTNYYVINPEGQLLKCTVNLKSLDNQIGYLEVNGNIKKSNYINKWRYVGGISNVVPEKCRECPMWANCFNSTCPSATLSKGITSTHVCNKLERCLLLIYKGYPDIFKKPNR